MTRIVVAAAVAMTLFSCTTPEEKVNTLISKALVECQAAEGAFFEVEVIVGKDNILRDVCGMPVENIEIIEEYTSKATVGPYEVTAGIDDATGTWVLSGVKWNDLKKAMRSSEDGVDAGSREQALAMWEAAQASVPESRWIRQERFANALALRKAVRGKDENPIGLGKAQKEFDEVVAWAKEKDPDLEQKIRVDVVEYHKNQADKLEASLENIGSQDEWLESLIKQAKKEGTAEDAAKYQKELDDSIAGRDAKIEKVENNVNAAKKLACDELAKVNGSGIKDDEIRKRVTAVKSGTDCS